MQYETITMPDAGIGSFLTSNMDEIDDNILMFGHGGGINSIKEVADRISREPAKDRCHRADRSNPPGGRAVRKHHRHDHYIRRDREDRTFRKRDERQPPDRLGMRRQVDDPVVKLFYQRRNPYDLRRARRKIFAARRD